jgi:hypothetical protein
LKRKQLEEALRQTDTEESDVRRVLALRLEELKSKRKPLIETLEHVDALLKTEGWVPTVSDDVRAPDRTPPLQAAHDLLRKRGKPVHYREIASQLLEQGVNIPGQNPAATLLSRLSRDDAFKRFGRGVYGLATWKSRHRRETKKQSRQRGLHKPQNASQK